MNEMPPGYGSFENRAEIDNIYLRRQHFLQNSERILTAESTVKDSASTNITNLVQY